MGVFVGPTDIGLREGPVCSTDGALVGLFVGAIVGVEGFRVGLNVGGCGDCHQNVGFGVNVGSRVGRCQGCLVGVVVVGCPVNVGRLVNVGYGVGYLFLVRGLGVGHLDGSLAKITKCTASFVVAFPLESFEETVVVVSSEDP